MTSSKFCIKSCGLEMGEHGLRKTHANAGAVMSLTVRSGPGLTVVEVRRKSKVHWERDFDTNY